MTRPLPLALLLCACAALTACTDDAARTPAAATAEPTSAAPGPSPSVAAGSATAAPASSAAAVPSTTAGAPPFPADTTVDTEQPTGEPLTVVAVRAAGQDGYDRVVFELRGKAAGAPGWRVEYVDEARQDGSGEEVDVAGEETIAVFVEGVGLPFETGQEEASQDLTPRDTDRVREVDLQATYEGRFTAFIGTDQRVPFRVFRLSDPARVVVDVRHR